jgi:hypothetical protein
MRTAVRAGGFAALLTVVLGAGWGAGTVVRPPDPALAPGSVTLVARTTTLEPGLPGDFAFTLTGATAGPPVLTVVRRDAAVLLHTGPSAGPDGTWHAPLTLPAPGPYRVVVSVAAPGGPVQDLTADLTAPGPFIPAASGPARVAEVDGYQVRLDGDLVPGRATQVFATVSRGGAPVGDLEPVDDAGPGWAFGRLDAVHADDLALARVHPDAAPPAPAVRGGPGIAFTAEVPAAGTYRLFLDFRHGGVRRTAVFTVPTGSTG